MTAATRVKPRRVKIPFDDTIPRHWFHDSPIATHLANGLNLIFPHGERFFVRSVNRYMDQIDDDQLRAEVKAFFSQEGRHAHEHERFIRILREQGYDVDTFLGRYHRVASFIEKLTPAPQRLAVTAAAEHFTALMGHNALCRDFIDGAHPTMKRLLKWHAAEEIEHKAVAFDVLQKLHPSYALRIAGLAQATALLMGFWLTAAYDLMRQDGLSRREALEGMLTLRNKDAFGETVFKAGIKAYLRRDFHPNDTDDIDIAKAFLATLEDDGEVSVERAA